MKEDIVLPQIIEANDEGAYNAIVFTGETFTLRTYTQQLEGDKWTAVYEDIMTAEKWSDFMARCRGLIEVNFAPGPAELIAEYRQNIERLNEISSELARKHDIGVSVISLEHRHPMKSGDVILHSSLNANFRKVL